MRLQTILRLVELIICVVLLIFWYAVAAYAPDYMTICGAVLGYLIITAILLALEFTSFDSIPVYIILGAVLFLVGGIYLFVDMPSSHSNHYTKYLIFSILFLANGVIYLVDFIVVLRGD